jgi:hypothetical protein
MKQVISFCLFGDESRYVEGAVKNTVLAKKYMPDWECWFYVPANYPGEIIDRLLEAGNAKVIKIRQPIDFTFTLSRFLVFSDTSVDRAIVRDTDSRLSAREIKCVQEWIDSDLDFHIIKDHPTGMWGAKADAIRNIKELMDIFLNPPAELEIDRNQRGVDQEFLGEKVYPIAIESCLYHSEYYHCKIKGNSIQKKFPTEDRFPRNHIGAALTENDEYYYKIDRMDIYTSTGSFLYQYDFDLLGEE